MKKILAIYLCAVCACFSFAQAANPQANKAADVAALQKKIAELEQLLTESQQALYDLVAKDMEIISKLRTENRALKAKIAAIETSVPSTVAKSKNSQNKISEWKSPQQQYDEIKAQSDKVKKDAKDIENEFNEIAKKAEEAEKARLQSKQLEASKAKEAEKNSSFWDSAFPF